MVEQLSTAQRDRAVGAVVGLAVGDALGAGYEFAPAPAPHEVDMIGGGLGPFTPGEWTDDTSMAIPLLRVLAQGRDLVDEATQDAVVGDWIEWSGEAADIGNTTKAALTSGHRSAADLTRHTRSGFASGLSGAGNGTLMRTTPIVLGYLHDPVGLTTAARLYSDITHGDPDAADACVLWNHAQRKAILRGVLDLTIGLVHLPPDRRSIWAERISAAQAGRPRDFTNNGWVVAALQCAWSAITSTAEDAPGHVERALRQAVAAGHDTDTVAAIAGSLLGARWGVSAIPIDWRRRIHGWPGLTGQDLVRLASTAVTGQPWPRRLYTDLSPGAPPVALPSDPGVWIGDVFGLEDLPDEVTAVVSLCRLGTEQVPEQAFDKHVEVWLIDSASPAENPHLEFVARDTVDLIARLRQRGETVYVHCVQAHSRTPFIAAMYVAQVSGATGLQALTEVGSLLPDAHPNSAFLDVLSRM